MTKIYPVLMVGGSGTRLWPVSREDRPKQFQKLTGTTQTLFQQTVLRTSGMIDDVEFAAPIIIGAARYQAIISEQLEEIGVAAGAIILEPSARNTAAVAAIAAAHVQNTDPDGLALLMPSDHHVADQAAFGHAVAAATKTAAEDWIITFGIQPTRPETGFGYIEAGDALGSGARRISAFTEKPDHDTAQKWFEAGRHSWNAGIFMFRPSLMLKELGAHANGVHLASLDAFSQARRAERIIHLDAAAFNKVPQVSIDVAVMEKTQRAAVCGPIDCGWSDIGSWPMLAELDDSPPHPRSISIASDTSYVRTDGSVFIAAVGLEDMIVVAHEGSVLIMPKSRAQDVKRVIETLKTRGQDEIL